MGNRARATDAFAGGSSGGAPRLPLKPLPLPSPRPLCRSTRSNAAASPHCSRSSRPRSCATFPSPPAPRCACSTKRAPRSSCSSCCNSLPSAARLFRAHELLVATVAGPASARQRDALPPRERDGLGAAARGLHRAAARGALHMPPLELGAWRTARRVSVFESECGPAACACGWWCV